MALFGSSRALTQRSDELREEFHQSYPISANGRISLENINGGVQIRTWDRNEVKVDAVKHAYTQERLDEARIDISAESGNLRIKTRYPEENLSFHNDEDRRRQNPASVEYSLTVPQEARLDSIELINGSLDVQGVKGNVKASSINGRVTASGLAGDVKLSTINGPVEATLDALTNVRQVSLSSVNGSVNVVVPSDVNAEVRASTVHGNISNDFGIPVRKGQYVGRDLSATLGSGGVTVKLQNVNGSISVRHKNDGRRVSSVSNTLESSTNEEDADVAMSVADAHRIAEDAVREAQEELKKLPDQEAMRAQIAEAKRAQVEALRAQREALREADRVRREFGGGYRGGDSSHYRLIERDNKSFAVGSSPVITVRTFDGSVSVRAWDKNEVSYSLAKRAADEEALKRVNVEAVQSGNKVDIVAKYDNQDRRFGNDIQAQVNLEVFVPKTARVAVSSGDGRLEVEGVSGGIQAKTGDGPVYVTDSSGQCQIESGDGSVRLEGFNGDANIRTGDGRIVLQGRFNQLSAQTGDGAISLELPSDFNATVETQSESVYNDGIGSEQSTGSTRTRRWNIGRGGNVLRLQTGGGKIFLRRLSQ
jgi:DUF4097 and DUF4098 domain-containing protein YvlB